jgi:hypothetical protein
VGGGGEGSEAVGGEEWVIDVGVEPVALVDVDDRGGGCFGGVEVFIDVFGDLTGVVVAVGPLFSGAERVERSDEEVEVEVERLIGLEGERAAGACEGAGAVLFRGERDGSFVGGVP